MKHPVAKYGIANLSSLPTKIDNHRGQLFLFNLLFLSDFICKKNFSNLQDNKFGKKTKEIRKIIFFKVKKIAKNYRG